MKFILFFIIFTLNISLTYAKELIDICSDKSVLVEIPNKNLSFKNEISLNKNEEILVCGDKKIEEWKNPSIEQKIYFLKKILNNKGLYKFSESIRNNKVKIRIQDFTLIKKITIENLDQKIIKNNKTIKRKKLSKDNLDNYENWLKNKLILMGKPCAKIDTIFNPGNETIFTKISNNKKSKIKKIDREIIKLKKNYQIDKDLIERFELFKENEYYDKRLIEISKNLLIREGIVQGVTFQEQCNENGDILIKEKITLGKNRVLKVGVGYNSEENFLGRIFWRNSRLNNKGNNFSAELNYTQQRKYIDLKYKSYPFDKYLKNFFLENRFKIEEITELGIDGFYSEYRLLLNKIIKWKNHIIVPRTGLIYYYTDDQLNFQIENSRGLSLYNSILINSLDYQFLQQNPSKGYQIFIESRYNNRNFISNYSAHRLKLEAKYLTNPLNFDPVFWVLGFKAGIFNTDSRDFDRLPFFYFNPLGGSRNIRGFQRNQIRNQQFGSLATAYLSIENRFTNFNKYNIDPLLFVDLAKIGDNIDNLNSPLYYSPGLGVRWRSPVGTFRLTYGQGYLKEKKINDQVYFSFGEEF